MHQGKKQEGEQDGPLTQQNSSVDQVCVPSVGSSHQTPIISPINENATNARFVFEEPKGDPSPVQGQQSRIVSQCVPLGGSIFSANTKPGDLYTGNEKAGLEGYFGQEKSEQCGPCLRGIALGDSTAAESFPEAALLGRLQVAEEKSDSRAIYLNTHEPFCLATVGVQGAGKSHTLACVLESCLLSFTKENITKLQKPMTALVLHFDQNTVSMCEAAGLMSPAPMLMDYLKKASEPCCVPKSKAAILVSPTYYKQRKAFYGDRCNVHPLLFRWRTLPADYIKRIMRVGATDNQLYVACCMSLLRKYQRADVVPDFDEFIEELKEVCLVKGQHGPLVQRIALLESMIAESEVNKDIAQDSMDLPEACRKSQNLIIVDFTDPLLSKEEANGLFQVITEQFRSFPLDGGKLLA